GTGPRTFCQLALAKKFARDKAASLDSALFVVVMVAALWLVARGQSPLPPLPRPAGGLRGSGRC
ncbi:MAG: hypothetical protein ABI586_02980, partial [Candidatus Nanopelagicales bacterium]